MSTIPWPFTACYIAIVLAFTWAVLNAAREATARTRRAIAYRRAARHPRPCEPHDPPIVADITTAPQRKRP